MSVNISPFSEYRRPSNMDYRLREALPAIFQYLLRHGLFQREKRVNKNLTSWSGLSDDRPIPFTAKCIKSGLGPVSWLLARPPLLRLPIHRRRTVAPQNADARGVASYGGGTAPDLHRLPFWPAYGGSPPGSIQLLKDPPCQGPYRPFAAWQVL